MCHLDQVTSQRLGCSRAATGNGFPENLGLHELERDQVLRRKDRNIQYKDKPVLLNNVFSYMVLIALFSKNSG